MVFEGFKTAKRNIKENTKPNPILMYARSKVQNEIDEQNHQLEMMEGILQLISIKMDTLKNSDMQTYDEIVILQNNILNCKINSICESSLKEMAHEICSKLEITSFGDYCTSFYADVYGHEFK